VANRLLVIYHLETRQVLATIEGGAITKRAQLLNHVKGHPLSTLAFYYEEEGASIDKIKDRVIQLVHGAPPVLCDATRYPKTFPLFIASRRAALERCTHIKVDFEGGMGDQVMELEAVKQLKAARPDLNIAIGMRHPFRNIAPILESHGTISDPGHPHADTSLYGYVNTSTQYISDPRGALYGKASLYGGSMGLDRVQQSISFSMPSDRQEYWAARAGVHLQKIKHPLLGIHIRSGSGGAKSWNHENAEALAAKWHNDTGGDIYLCGATSDFSMTSPFSITLPNGSDWASVGALILALDILVCIDSGPMHLARSGGIPHIILWGGTGPGDILGREAQSHDLRASLPCIDNICYSCPRGNALCMKAITPDHVWAAITNLYPDSLNKKTMLFPGQPALTDVAPTDPDPLTV